MKLVRQDPRPPKPIAAFRLTWSAPLQVLSALCDILSCTPADLVATTAENAGVRKTADGDLPAPPSGTVKLRPRAARILPGP